MKRILLIIAAALALVSAASAQTDKRWVPISRNDRTCLDMQTIRYRPSDSNYATFWLKTKEKDGTVWRIRYELHRNRLYRMLSSSVYDADGDIIRSSDKVTEWQELVPESVMETMYDYLFSPAPRAERY
jgi:hypothetical protein